MNSSSLSENTSLWKGIVSEVFVFMYTQKKVFGNLQPLQIKVFMITCETTGNSSHVSDNPVLQSFSGDSDHHKHV